MTTSTDVSAGSLASLDPDTVSGTWELREVCTFESSDAIAQALNAQRSVYG